MKCIVDEERADEDQEAAKNRGVRSRKAVGQGGRRAARVGRRVGGRVCFARSRARKR